MKNLPEQDLHHKLYLIRGCRVMLDRDLAALYGVETRILNRSVKRNMERFPGDFMFQLLETEEESLRSQIGISKSDQKGGRRYPQRLSLSSESQCSHLS